MKIVAVCGAGIGTSAILKLNAERALERLDIDAVVEAGDLASVTGRHRDAQVILTSPQLAGRLGPTRADVVVIDNYLDVSEIADKLERAIG
ncbi:MAG TPA: PTS sugar transporter subunit IIB [Microbacteriaceae bacterium]|nr:PTS sugar transporter subunit IIB [Microbacteriaceae bacterium]